MVPGKSGGVFLKHRMRMLIAGIRNGIFRPDAEPWVHAMLPLPPMCVVEDPVAVLSDPTRVWSSSYRGTKCVNPCKSVTSEARRSTYRLTVEGGVFAFAAKLT